MEKNVDHLWQKGDSSVFWGEIAPCDHVVQIYENDSVFFDTLAGFVGSGINSGDGVIVIATDAHLQALNGILSGLGVHVDTLINDDRYLPLNAEETLSRFMINGWPDENLFRHTITSLIEKARRKNRRVRAFGEMVALLWAQGHNGATVQLEHIWNRYCQNEICLFCAYPKSGFTGDIQDSIDNICGCHSKVISGSNRSLTKVMYRN